MKPTRGTLIGLLLVCACSTDIDGRAMSAEPYVARVYDGLFDPCTIPTDSLRVLGSAMFTEPVDDPNALTCRWFGSDGQLFITVARDSTFFVLQSIPTYPDRREVQVGGRAVSLFSSDEAGGCVVLTETVGGSVYLYWVSLDDSEDSCALTESTFVDIAEFLPDPA